MGERMKEESAAFTRLLREYRSFRLLARGDEFDRLKRSELIGKITIAAEYNLITIEEWETLFEKLYRQDGA